MSRIKKNGEVFTPSHIVKEMLDLCGYSGEVILEKHVIDNSAGNGAFLTEVVRRYLDAYFDKNGTYKGVKSHLEKYIHGIEIDSINYRGLIKNLNNVVSSKVGYEIPIEWDVLETNTLYIDKYNHKMDFVVGNPPYVRIHNIGVDDRERLKELQFSVKGMSDLYIAFYELGINMLNEKGVLIYINPSSLFNSKAAQTLRKYLIESKLLKKIVNFGHMQVFENITTYTAIIMLDKKNSSSSIEYFEYGSQGLETNTRTKLSYDSIYKDNNFYFSDLYFSEEFQKIMVVDEKNKGIEVKNGFATLADKVFIQESFPDVRDKIKLIKSSTGQWNEAVFPYDKKGDLCPFTLLDKSTQKYLLKHKDILVNRSIKSKEEWYAFGRTQGIKDIGKEKIAINNILRTKDDLKINYVAPGEGVYSGLYITSDRFDFGDIISTLKSSKFEQYVKTLGKYKSGGYYTFSSKDLKKYLIYELEA